MTIPIKIVLGVLGGGVAAASGYGIYEFIKPKTIGEKLSWEGKTVLDLAGDTSDTDWEKLYTKYSTNTEDKFKNISPEINSKEKLKEHCKAVIEKKLSDSSAEDDLNKSKLWCVKESEKLNQT